LFVGRAAMDRRSRRLKASFGMTPFNILEPAIVTESTCRCLDIVLNKGIIYH
jgi:hypothetical protein